MMMLANSLSLWIPLLMAVSQATCSAQQPTLQELMDRNSMALELEAGKLSGPGAAFLQEEATVSQFFLIGEQHGVAEIAQMTAALLPELNQLGYSHLAIETSPWAAAKLHGLASAGDPIKSIEEHFAHRPFSIPFYGLREEAAMLAAAVRAFDSREPLWGIDQEFILGAAAVLDSVLEDLGDRQARSLAEALVKREAEAVRSVLGGQRPAGLAMMKPPAELQQLRKRLGELGEEAKQQLVAGLLTSAEIYSHAFSGRGYDNNRLRSDLIRRQFLEACRRARQETGQAPKAIIKTGAVHALRGLNLAGTEDVGTLAAQLGFMEGQASFHLLTLPSSGTHNAYLPFRSASAKQQPVAYQGSAQVFAPLAAGHQGEGWTLVDLRPLRPHARRLAREHPGLDRILLGYDAVLLIPAVRASTLLGQEE